MSLLDVGILLSFLAYAIWSGWSNKDKASENLEEYFLAGRSLSGWQSGLSMTATQFASDTPLLVTGLVATAGIFALWQMWIYAIAFLLLGFILAPLWRRSRVITDAELTELRYGKKPAAALRLVKAFYFGTLFNCIVLAWVFFAATRICEPFFLWHEWLPETLFMPFLFLVQWVDVPLTVIQGEGDAFVWERSASNLISLLLILLTTLFYSTTGGLRAVVRTDMLQVLIMFSATFVYMWIVVWQVGGLWQLRPRLEEVLSQTDWSLGAEQMLTVLPAGAAEAGFALLAVFSLQWLIQLNSDGTGYLAQRSMACRSDAEATKGALIFTYGQILVRSLMWLPLAVGVFVLFPPLAGSSGEMAQAEREFTYVLGMSELLPIGLKGLLLTAMLAALASTVDTHLNWGSSYWTNDIFRRFLYPMVKGKEPSGRLLVRVARISNVLILLVALVIATRLDSIQATWQISLLLGAGSGVVLVLRWFWWRINAWSEIAAIVCSLILAPTLYFTMENQAERLLLVAALSTFVAIVMAYLREPEDRVRLQEFFNRVRPPGFWAPFELHGGVQRMDLAPRLWGLGSSLVSLFALLVGSATWALQAPYPELFVTRGLWVGFCFGLALIVSPFWITWLRGDIKGAEIGSSEPGEALGG